MLVVMEMIKINRRLGRVLEWLEGEPREMATTVKHPKIPTLLNPNVPTHNVYIPTKRKTEHIMCYMSLIG